MSPYNQITECTPSFQMTMSIYRSSHVIGKKGNLSKLQTKNRKRKTHIPRLVSKDDGSFACSYFISSQPPLSSTYSQTVKYNFLSHKLTKLEGKWMADKNDSKSEKNESKLTSEKRIESTELALQNLK